MSRLARSPSNRQIWITRGHLAALGVATLFIAVLAFLVGYQVGTSRSTVLPEVAQAESVVPDPEQEGALEALLREVEYAQAVIGPDGIPATEPDDVEFTRTLGAGQDVDVAVVHADANSPTDDVTVLAEPTTDHTPAPPEAPGDGLPQGGWAVQVASFPSAAEADERIADLRADGLNGYRVAALVDGQTWYRVRVGGYDTRKEAEAARAELAASLGDPHLLVAEAP